ncbi:hypothetical protein RBB50_011031 [Rhinocladiella similis]
MADTREIRWQTPDLTVILTIESDQIVRLKEITPVGERAIPPRSSLFSESSLPLTEVRLAGEGTDDTKSSKTLVCGAVTKRLKYQSHQESTSGQQQSIEVTSHDDVSKLTVTATLVAYPGSPVLRSYTKVRNDGDTAIILCQVTSLVVGGLTGGSREWFQDYVASSATNTWFREAQWHDHDLPSIGLDSIGVCELNQGHLGGHTSYSVSNRGGFSTGGMLAMGMLKKRDGQDTWLWQIENNGSWRWELGDFKEDIYVAISGPNDFNHSWKECLEPEQSFTTVPCAITHVHGGIEAAFGALTDYRRCIRRKHVDNEELPIIFNDFMNCLMGDPDEEKVKGLIGPAAYAGAEYFVVDAGWYADTTDWWDSVGEWKPSRKRFPNGLKSVLDAIRLAGMTPGVWLEPEVVGIRSNILEELPAEAFFQENGRRAVEKGRYQLDYRSPMVRQRMDRIVDDLVLNYGVGYFKFDYNIDVVYGTDFNAFSSGAGALGHNRAYLEWVTNILDRHPGLVIENCSSGGQRLDYALLAIHSVQSTSDQQDPVRYAAVSAAIATAVTPEQSASWAYPQPEWSDEINALTVINSLMGRVHLSGALHRLSKSQLSLVRDGMNVYKKFRHDVKSSKPFWPLGLPGWHDDWMAVGLKAGSCQYLAVWRRGGDVSCSLPVSGADGNTALTAELLYPAGFEVDWTWDSEKRALKLTFPASICARLLRIGEQQSA